MTNHILNAGVAGHWVHSRYWSTVVTADYYKVLDRYSEPYNTGWWELSAGMNLNIDTTKYVGAYITKDVNHTAEGVWRIEDGFGFGMKFGIDF